MASSSNSSLPNLVIGHAHHPDSPTSLLSSTSASATNNNPMSDQLDSPRIKSSLASKEKGGASEFVKKLYRMLESTQFADTVCWGFTGDSFVVKDMNSFTRTILPLHFKHSNFASFVRQLNKYDFHKVKASEDGTLTYGEHTWEFKHPNFRVDMKASLEFIKRKPPAARKPTPGSRARSPAAASKSPVDASNDNNGNSMHLHNTFQTQLDSLHTAQATMTQHMATLGHDYQAVIGEMINFQRNMIAQDQLMQNLIQYLVNLEADQKASSAPSSDLSIPFVPSASAQKLISTYTEVSRASYDQMADLSRRASISGGALPHIPLAPPGFGRLDVGSIASTSGSSNHSREREGSLVESKSNPGRDHHQSDSSKIDQVGIRSRNNSNGSIGNVAESHQGGGNTSYYQRELQMQSQQQEQHHLQQQRQQQQHHQQQQQQHQSFQQMVHPSLMAAPTTSCMAPSSSSLSLGRKPAYVPGWAVPPRVLLVEDDAVCRKISSKFLQIFGCDIDHAADGVSAVNKMNLEKYDLVLMDIIMPNLDGVSATSLIRQFDPITPIISMTANSGPNEIMTYFSHGMNDILPKPFTKEGLLGMLEKHLTHLKVMQQMAEIPRALGFTDNQIQDAVAVSTVGPEGNVINPFKTMGISDADYVEMLQGIALEKEGKRALEVVQGNEREGKRARFQEVGEV